MNWFTETESFTRETNYKNIILNTQKFIKKIRHQGSKKRKSQTELNDKKKEVHSE